MKESTPELISSLSLFAAACALGGLAAPRAEVETGQVLVLPPAYIKENEDIPGLDPDDGTPQGGTRGKDLRLDGHNPADIFRRNAARGNQNGHRTRADTRY